MPATTYITDATLKEACSTAIGQVPDDFASHWDVVISNANVAAYYFILRKLGERGYTKTQIDAWPEAAIFNTDIGMLFAFQKKGILSSFSDTFIRSIDRRKELDSALLMDADGNFVYPSGSGQESIVDAMEWNGYDFNPAVEFTFYEGMREKPGNYEF